MKRLQVCYGCGAEALPAAGLGGGEARPHANHKKGNRGSQVTIWGRKKGKKQSGLSLKR